MFERPGEPPEEWPTFEAATPRLAGLTYGSEEYEATLRELGPAIKAHQRGNRHHPEFHADGVNGMTLPDLIEMLCDWKAATERHDNGSIVKSFEHNRERFKIEPQLLKVLINTAIAAGWMERQPELPIGTLVDTNVLDGFGGPATIVDTRPSNNSRYKVRMLDGRQPDFWAHDFEVSVAAKAG